MHMILEHLIEKLVLYLYDSKVLKHNSTSILDGKIKFIFEFIHHLLAITHL